MISLDLIEKKENKELCEKILEMFSTVPQGMTAFQIHKFVLGDLEFPTVDSKWWQAKLELWVRIQNIIISHYEYRKKIAKTKELKANIDEIEYNNSQLDSEIKSKIQTSKNDSIIEYTKVEIEENEFAIVCIKKRINDVLKEMWAFWDIMQELEPKMKFSKDDKEKQEEEFWTKKALNTPELVNRHSEVFLKSKEVTGYYKDIYKRKKTEDR
jgi:hypothetical protein